MEKHEKVKKVYVKPQIKEVKLVVEEAILSSCKLPDRVQATCGSIFCADQLSGS